MKLKQLQEATYAGHEDHVKRLVKYANDPNYVAKIKSQYDGTVKIADRVGYYDQNYIDEWYEPEDGMKPFVAVDFAGHSSSDIFDPGEFAEMVEIYELKKKIL
jgi:hypothetical protein